MSEPSPRPSALIIGRGPDGAQAALHLAESGAEVTLLTSADWLWPGTLGLAGVPALLDALRHPRVNLLTGASVEWIEPAENPSVPPGLCATVHQLPRYVDPERCTACGACAEVCPILLPGEDDAAYLSSLSFTAGREAVASSSELNQGGDAHHRAIYRGAVPTVFSIDKAGTAPCRHACPIDQRAQGYVALIRAGDFSAAYRTIKRENPFPSVCGRVCNHRCEEACTRCEIDEPVAVMALKRFVADWAAEASIEVEVELAPRSGYQVAVVGSGPAGLTAARELNRLGHTVTIFEALPVAGGMMRVGIPAFRLPRERLQWEIDEILCEGVELRTNTRVEDVESLLNEGYDAVVLASGLHVSRWLSLPGAGERQSGSRVGDADKTGVMGAVEFLRQVNLGRKPNLVGRRIVVVGGGSTAMDTARVCRRLGGKVDVIYRRSRVEMPAHDSEVEDAQREGVSVHYLTNPAQVLRRDRQVVGVECVRTELGDPDESGRQRPVAVDGSRFVLPADVVLMAIGQVGDLSMLTKSAAVDPTGVVQFDPETLMTARPGLFVAGDMAGTHGYVVDAIASGARAARSVDRHLLGADGTTEPVTQPVVALGQQEVSQRLTDAAPRGTARMQTRSTMPLTLLGDFGETAIGLTEAEAMAEAARCLGCGLCSECLACVEACPAGAINHEAQARTFKLDADVVLFADADSALEIDMWEPGTSGVYGVANGVSLSGALDQALRRLSLARPTRAASVAAPGRWQLAGVGGNDRIRHLGSRIPDLGIFLCRCGGEIERAVDLSAVMTRVEGLPGVATVQEIDFACHPDGHAALRSAIENNDLRGAVLAACACCALDHVCYSCSTQRTRCKERLGVWDDVQGFPFEFVNVREQCAFVHAENPIAATFKAGDMIAASVAAMQVTTGSVQGVWSREPTWTSKAMSGKDSTKLSSPRSRNPISAVVDPVRCRGCEDCELACGLQAMHVVSRDGLQIAQVDLTHCLGCGVCLAVCSSGAIFASDMTDGQAEAVLTAMGDLSGKTVVFSCNWGAYSAVEAAGVQRLSYDASVRLVRLMCAGRAHEGLILRAFACGAAQVLVLACGHEGTESLCRYHTGNAQAGRSVEQARRLLDLLGIDPARLALVEVRTGDGSRFVAAVAELSRVNARGPGAPADVIQGWTRDE